MLNFVIKCLKINFRLKILTKVFLPETKAVSKFPNQNIILIQESEYPLFRIGLARYPAFTHLFARYYLEGMIVIFQLKILTVRRVSRIL